MAHADGAIPATLPSADGALALSEIYVTADESVGHDLDDGSIILLSQDVASKRLGRTIWRGWRGYHRRSRAETKMHCVTLLGQRLSARDFNRQVAEFQVRVAVLNRFTALGGPVTDVAG